MEAIFKLYEGLQRLGPGSKETTLRALEVIRADLPESPKIIDIGCGTGAQTLDLAESIQGEITAVDIYQPYLDDLLNKAQKKSLKSSIKTLNQNMGHLSLPEVSYDLIWSEGAIYLVGMENGLRSWQKYLSPDGFIAFSEISWFRDDPPEELSHFWSIYYPALKSIPQNLACIQETGFKIIDHFSLSPKVWWKNYYIPLIEKIEIIQRQNDIETDLQNVINETNEEIELFKSYAEWYGYEFYIVQST